MLWSKGKKYSFVFFLIIYIYAISNCIFAQVFLLDFIDGNFEFTGSMKIV